MNSGSPASPLQKIIGKNCSINAKYCTMMSSIRSGLKLNALQHSIFGRGCNWGKIDFTKSMRDALFSFFFRTCNTNHKTILRQRVYVLYATNLGNQRSAHLVDRRCIDDHDR